MLGTVTPASHLLLPWDLVPASIAPRGTFCSPACSVMSPPRAVTQGLEGVMSLNWDCDVMSHCDVTAGELVGISVLLWSLSLMRWLVPSSSSRSHPGRAGSCCAVRLSLPVQPRRTRQVKCPFAILAARLVACFCLGQSLPLPALLSGDFTSSDAQTSQDLRDWMLQPEPPGPSQHPIPFLGLHPGS